MRDAESKTRVVSWRFIASLLLFAGVVVFIIYISDGFEGAKKKQAVTTSPVSQTTQTPKSRVYTLSKQSRMVPKEVLTGGASRAVPMTDAARRIIFEKYTPSMIGVPQTGEPFRLVLPRPMAEDLMKDVMEALRIPGKEVVFIKTESPPVLFGFMTKISGEMEAYCDKNGDECAPVDVYFTK